MRIAPLTAILCAAVLTAGTALAQSDKLSESQPTTINGIQTVCTGVTTDARADPQWRAYSLRLEFAGNSGQYLGDETVKVSGNGQSVSVSCAGPWILMMLPAGTYKVSADVAEAGHKEVTVHVPGHVIVHFPNAGGAIPPSDPIASQ